MPLSECRSYLVVSVRFLNEIPEFGTRTPWLPLEGRTQMKSTTLGVPKASWWVWIESALFFWRRLFRELITQAGHGNPFYETISGKRKNIHNARIEMYKNSVSTDQKRFRPGVYTPVSWFCVVISILSMVSSATVTSLSRPAAWRIASVNICKIHTHNVWTRS